MEYISLNNLIIFSGLIFATITDLKKREVPDYLNYSLIAVGLGFSLIMSLVNSNVWFFINSIAGFFIGYLIAAIMYYGAQWGGGDAKMLMAIGALLGVDVYNIYLTHEIPIFLTLILTIFISGAIYGIFYTFYIMIKEWNSFKKKWMEYVKNSIILKLRIGIIVMMFVGFFYVIFVEKNIVNDLLLLLFMFCLVLFFYLMLILKVVEKGCMIKFVDVDKLTEGDWIVEDVVVNKKRICGPKDLGISLEQIKLLKKLKIKKILIKEGMPFIPGFLIGFLIILFYGNWLLNLL